MDVVIAEDEPQWWTQFTQRPGPPDTRTLGRWLAVDGKPIGAIEVWLRPDDRAFVRLETTSESAGRALIVSARSAIARPVHIVCRPTSLLTRDTLVAMGFEVVLTEDSFSIAFAAAAQAVERAWVPGGTSIVAASDVPADRLFELDTELRRLVPGTDGWVGDRAMFDAELAEAPPFDPTGYLVGVDDATHELLGLIRFWRNDDGPRLGLVAVRPSHRSTTLGPALIKAGLRGARGWGWSHFETGTARSNRHLHHRLLRIGAQRIGSFDVMRL